MESQKNGQQQANTESQKGEKNYALCLNARGEGLKTYEILQGGTLYTITRNEDGSLGEVAAKYTYEGKEAGKVSTMHRI